MDEGMGVADSIARATASAGRAVIVAGGTVAIAVLGLAAVGIPFVTRLGQAAAIAVVVAVLAAITLLPAALAIAGQGLGRWRLPFVSGPRAVDLDAPADRMHGWARWSLAVTRRPWPYLVASVMVLVALALPVFWMELGQVDAGSDPPGSTTREAYHLIATGFGPGFNGPVQVVLEGPRAKAHAQDVAQRARDLAGVIEVSPPVASPVDDVALINVVPSGAPSSPRTTDMVERLPQRLRPVAGAGTVVYATGATAIGVDLSERVAERLPWFIAAIILISFVLLMFEFRSLLVPLQAALMNLLSVGAAFGVVVAVFQWGFLRSQLGVPEAVAIEAWVPMIMFAILFGLSMDYEVFLLSRVRDAWLDGEGPHRSVAIGLASTARVITAAALVMVSVFLAFVLTDDVIVKMLGVGLATAVLVDATIIRLMLAPALLSIFGRWNWWLPGRRAA
jgi:RND superfamily putative drug exporter